MPNLIFSFFCSAGQIRVLLLLIKQGRAEEERRREKTRPCVTFKAFCAVLFLYPMPTKKTGPSRGGEEEAD
jgi:hypothetical protein